MGWPAQPGWALCVGEDPAAACAVRVVSQALARPSGAVKSTSTSSFAFCEIVHHASRYTTACSTSFSQGLNHDVIPPRTVCDCLRCAQATERQSPVSRVLAFSSNADGADNNAVVFRCAGS